MTKAVDRRGITRFPKSNRLCSLYERVFSEMERDASFWENFWPIFSHDRDQRISFSNGSYFVETGHFPGEGERYPSDLNVETIKTTIYFGPPRADGEDRLEAPDYTTPISDY